MPKLIKGIKKKIKGKKAKGDNELFTPEEYEKYKKQKEAEEAEAVKSEQLDQAKGFEEEIPQEVESEVYDEATADLEEPELAESPSEQKGDWRNFFSATDTVLKKTTVNLEHIKESSYFQVNKKTEEEKEEPQETFFAAPVSENFVPSNNKWVDLDKGGIDDSLEEEDSEEEKQDLPIKEEQKEPKEEVVLKPLEYLPEVAAEDYADVFDTTFVDEVEAGQVQLFEIPDFEPDDIGEDPFDTSDVDKILYKDKPKDTTEEIIVDPSKQKKKKKKNLVNLGCAVDVLTGKLAEAPIKANKTVSAEQEVNLLADFEVEEVVTEKQTGDTQDAEQENNEAESNCEVDDILFGDNLTSDLPDATGIIVADKCNNENDEKLNEESTDHYKLSDDLAQFLDLVEDKHTESKEESHLQDLVSELGFTDKEEEKPEEKTAYKLKDIPKPLGFDVIGDNIKDEFDAEFAAIAAESLAKEKEKEIDEIGLAEGDDPFDTSCVNEVLGELEEEKDPFNVEFASAVIGKEKSKAPARPEPPRSTQAAEEIDPFDTSSTKVCNPIDIYDAVDEPLELPETLQPLQTKDQQETDFDPFDTSVADQFGQTELKVLEVELLSDLHKKEEQEDDFDFDPRADEVKNQSTIHPPTPVCLLSNSTEDLAEGSVLTPQTAVTSEENIESESDPFDTSIAENIQIKSLEVDFITNELQVTKASNKAPPRPVSPSCINKTNVSALAELSSVLNKEPLEEVDPFDTSIVDQFNLEGKADPKVNNRKENSPSQKDQLQLELKPPRPPSPFCLLATTPIDENPTLQPISKTLHSNNEEVDEVDPFDTSIAEQFGKTELRALESELLKKEPAKEVNTDNDFDPRSQEKTQLPKPRNPPPRPASPACLLSSNSPLGEQPLPLLSPVLSSNKLIQEEIDPFDTSIANQFGKAEIQNLESELLSDIPPQPTEFKPLRPPPHSCVFETTPTDTNPTLLPSNLPLPEILNPKAAEEIDPFDTSIADQFGKTELKALEKTLLIKEEVNKTSSISRFENILNPIKKDNNQALEVQITDQLFEISPSAESLPVLQPLSPSNFQQASPEVDPFDTSIADRFGSTELKVLESQLLVDSGTKRVLSDDEFDPREEEINVHKRPSPQSILDSTDHLSDQSLPVLQASAAVITVENIVEDIDPFDTSIADRLGPSKQELQLLDKELLSSN